jgi:hypothetical protein
MSKSKIKDRQDVKIIIDFATKLAKSQRDLDPEIKQALNKRWDLI